MSFWETSEGEEIAATGEYEAPSGSFEPFPDKTDLMAYIDEVQWQEGKPEYGGGRYINYRICVTAPEAFKNRKAYFKLWVDPLQPNPNKEGDKAKKQVDKDKRLLGAMAVNAGGGLLAINGEPTDDDLARELSQKPMVFKVGKWEMEGDTGEMRSGNYVMAVSPAAKGVAEVSAPAPSTPSAAPSSAPPMDDEIPF